MFNRWRSSWVAAPLAILMACAAPEADDELDLAESALIRASAGFTWQPPVALLPAFSSGTFEPRLAPVVSIDQVDAQGNPIKNIATYTGTAVTFGERLLRNLALQYYSVRFHSAAANLNPALNYRVRVLPAPGQPALGFADIDVVGNLLQVLTVDRRNYVPLVKGATLALRFRIDKHAVDKDGDGVFDWLDNCPSVKNPPVSLPPDVPPVTARAPSGCNNELTSCDPQEQPLNPVVPRQPDSDDDGVGDACDCPAGQVGTPPNCGTPKAFTELCLCDDGTIYEACSDVCGTPSQPGVCAELCGAPGKEFGCTLPGDPLCDPTAPCRAGFYPREPGEACEDIDECALNTDGCPGTSICRNTDGGFVCLPCPPPSQNDGTDSCTPL